MRNEFDAEPKASEKDGQSAWWLSKDKDEACLQAYTTAESIARTCGGRRQVMARLLMAYRNRVNLGYYPSSMLLRNLSSNGPLSFNVIRTCVNTMHSRVGKNKPKTKFTTRGGTSEDRARAKAYEMFTDGSFVRSNTRKRTSRALLNSLVFGCGVVRTSVIGGALKDTVVLPGDIILDPQDAADGDPRQLHEIYRVDKGQLALQFPKKSGEILMLSPDNTGFDAVENSDLHYDANDWSENSRKVRVVASYHLPSGPDAGDGMLCISAQKIPLHCEPWVYDRFPHSFLGWQDDPADFWPSGLAEELLGLQGEMNRTIRKIQVAIDRMANPYVLADRASLVRKEAFNGVPGSIIEYVGRAPQVVAFNVIQPEVFAHLDRIYMKAFELTGVSQASASGTPSSNLRSGRGALVEDDKQTVRFSTFEEAWEQFHLDIAEMHIRLTKDELPDTYKVASKDNASLQVITAKDLNLDADAYRIERWPASLLPDTPSGRVQMIESLRNILGDLVTPDEWIKMLDAPDVEEFTRVKTGPSRLVDHLIELALQRNIVAPVDAHMPLDAIIASGQQAYCAALMGGEPIDSQGMESLRMLMTKAVDIQVTAENEMAAKQAAAAQAASVVPPGAGPMMDPSMPDPAMAAAGAAGLPPPDPNLPPM